MLSDSAQFIVLMLLGLGIAMAVLSILILGRGKVYHRLRPESRPRRWVLMSMLVLFGVFVIWFPIWISWPGILLSRILLGLFGTAFFVVGMAIKWFAPLIDRYVESRGWRLR